MIVESILALRLEADYGRAKERNLFAQIREFSREAAAERFAKLAKRAFLSEARKLLDKARESGVEVISYYDSVYPERLKHIDDPPLLLFARGNLKNLEASAFVAIIGSRACSIDGNKFARQLAVDLSGCGVCVVSGFARGIDLAAHQGALLPGRLPGIAVFGSGVLHIYPSEQKEFAENFLQSGGLILSEYGLETAPREYFFPERNRIVSGLSDAVVVVEAKLRSGALITARLAAEQGREVFAVPGRVNAALSAGPNFLLKNGAAFCESAKDVLQVLPQISQMPSDAELATEMDHAGAIAAVTAEDQPLAKTLLDLLEREGIAPFDALIDELACDPSRLQRLLTTLELNGALSSDSFGSWFLP